MSQTSAGSVKKKNIIESFAEGARDGKNLVLNNMAPNTVFAFALIIILNITGLMPLIGKLFSPLMGIFGLPGEAATPCMLVFVSSSGGIAAAVALISDGTLSPEQCAIVFPYFMLVGAMLQYYGRLLGPSGLPAKYHKICIALNIIEGIAAMFTMRILLSFF